LIRSYATLLIADRLRVKRQRSIWQAARSPDPTTTSRFPNWQSAADFRVKHFFADLDARLGEVSFVAGDRFSVADITALVTVDFAAKAIHFSVPEKHGSLKLWYDSVSSRPSMAA
jgi:glutathione S-transferase